MKTNDDDDDGFTLNLCASLMLHFKLFGLNLALLFLPFFKFYIATNSNRNKMKRRLSC